MLKRLSSGLILCRAAHVSDVLAGRRVIGSLFESHMKRVSLQPQPCNATKHVPQGILPWIMELWQLSTVCSDTLCADCTDRLVEEAIGLKDVDTVVCAGGDGSVKCVPAFA